MIEHIDTNKIYGWDGANGGAKSISAPDNWQLMEKLNEVIDKINELEELLGDEK